MIFTVAGATAGGIVGKKTGWCASDTLIGLSLGMVIGFILDGAVWGTAYGIQNAVINKRIEENHIKTEQTIAQSAGFAKFTGNAFTVTKDDNRYYTEVFGVALEKAGSNPVFSSVTYVTDKEFYDLAFRYVDIKYDYGPTGQLISAYNEYRTPDFWIGNLRSHKAQDELMQKLVEITQGKVINKNFYASTDKVNKTVEPYTSGKYVVSGIGGINVNEDNSKVSFTIDLMDSEDGKKVVARRLLVVQEMTDEIANDPQKAYENYISNPGACQITEMKLGQTKIMDEEDYKVYVPEELAGEDYSLDR